MFSVRLLVLLALAGFAVSGDVCNCPKPRGMPAYSGKYNHDWWMKQNEETRALVGPTKGKYEWIMTLENDYMKDNDCTMATTALWIQAAIYRAKYLHTIVMVFTDGEVRRLKSFTEKNKNFPDLKCNGNGQWTYDGKPILVARVIGNALP